MVVGTFEAFWTTGNCRFSEKKLFCYSTGATTSKSTIKASVAVAGSPKLLCSEKPAISGCPTCLKSTYYHRSYLLLYDPNEFRSIAGLQKM